MLIEDINYRNTNIKEISVLLSKEILNIWSAANPELCPPVVSGEKAIADRIEKSWKILLSICHGREKKKTEDVWAQKLDKLFDITKCKCLIVLCADPESHCDSTSCYSNGAHTNCSCERQLKLPKYDLVWVKDQREKVGTKSRHQFGKVDKVESDRIEGMRLRREQDQQRLVRQQEKEKEREEQELRDREKGSKDMLETEDQECDQTASEVSKQHSTAASLSKRNYMDISNTAAATVRCKHFSYI